MFSHIFFHSFLLFIFLFFGFEMIVWYVCVYVANYIRYTEIFSFLPSSFPFCINPFSIPCAKSEIEKFMITAWDLV